MTVTEGELSGLTGLPVTLFPEQVVEMISDMIATGEIRGGYRLTEKALSDVLGVSRTPLREAIKILSARGLLYTRPNTSAEVRLPDNKEASELVQVMGWLWDKMAVLVTEKINEEQILNIKALHHEMCSLNQQDQMLHWAKLNRRFHESIIMASGNSVLCNIATNIQLRIYLCFAIGQRKVDRQKTANNDHSEILEALTKRDAACLAKRLMDHTNRAFKTAHESGIISTDQV